MRISSHKLLELFYRDFFEPPSRSSVQTAPTISKKPGQKSQVHFNNQVRVKKIKATGKNRSLRDDNSDDEEDDDEDEDFFGMDEGFEEGDEEEDEAEEGDQWDIGGSNDEESGESEEGIEGEEPEEMNGSSAIQRLKQDLFADDEEEIEQSKFELHVPTSAYQ